MCAGKVGCKLSHIKALRQAFTSDITAAAIFEDDFAWSSNVQPSQLYNIIQSVQDNLPNWRVIGLSMNIMSQHVARPELRVKVGVKSYALVQRVTDAQTTHAYIVRKSYIPVLRNIFELCDVKVSYEVAIDQCWKSLQQKDEWYAFTPQLGVQRSGYSDIEQKEVSYFSIEEKLSHL